jgi:hypothetical protein
MPSQIESRLWMVALLLSLTWTTHAVAQVGEVLDDEEIEDDGGEDVEESRERDDQRERDDEDDAVDEADVASAEADDYNHSALPWRVGADNKIEVGGHVFGTFFTSPSLPNLNPGLGFQGRIAFDLISSIVAEGNVGVMFNNEYGSSESSYTTAFLRAGARYPIDLHAKPILFFLGAGVALDFFGATTVTVEGDDLKKSAIAPAIDAQLGAIYDVHEHWAIEVIVQGSYAFSNVVFLNDSASWISICGGASYDL